MKSFGIPHTCKYTFSRIKIKNFNGFTYLNMHDIQDDNKFCHANLYYNYIIKFIGHHEILWNRSLKHAHASRIKIKNFNGFTYLNMIFMMIILFLSCQFISYL